MESSRGKQPFDIEIILCELEKFPRIKEKKKGEEKGSFQFSFATKLMNTIDWVHLPISKPDGRNWHQVGFFEILVFTGSEY
jgi:hypothetical protein